MRASVVMTPGPPALVTMARAGPRGGGWWARISAMLLIAAQRWLSRLVRKARKTRRLTMGCLTLLCAAISKQVGDGRDAQDAGPADRRVEDGVGAGQRPGVRRGGARPRLVPAGLDDDDVL